MSTQPDLASRICVELLGTAAAKAHPGFVRLVEEVRGHIAEDDLAQAREACSEALGYAQAEQNRQLYSPLYDVAHILDGEQDPQLRIPEPTDGQVAPSSDPWGQSASTARRLPNLFSDLDDNTVTVTTQQTGDVSYVQIKLGTTELRLDPIEAHMLGTYVAKVSDQLHGQVLGAIFADLRKSD